MIGILDCGIGNLGSVLNMLKFLGVPSRIVNTPEEVMLVSKFIFPGVGSWDNGLQQLHKTGILAALRHQVLIQKKPFLGICLGMQLLFETSEEGDLPGLSWLSGHLRRFNFSDINNGVKKIKVPHMGWNQVKVVKDSMLTCGLEEDARFYFVHSYFLECDENTNILMSCNYGIQFTCAVNKENIYGVQFHPEKSHRFGMFLMKNFSDL